MTAPDHSTSGFDSNARGLAVLAVAVVVGLLLLLNAGDGGASEQVSAGNGDLGGTTESTVDISGIGDGSDESTTTTPDQTTTSSVPETADTRPPSQVKVLVLNSGGPTGTAGSTSDSIGETGFVMQPAANAATRGAATTVVYYAEGYQADAEAVASVLGKSSDSVKAMPSTSPGPGADSANVVVVLGADTPPASSGSSGTTTTTAAN
jgi:hypothetical protein